MHKYASNLCYLHVETSTWQTNAHGWLASPAGLSASVVKPRASSSPQPVPKRTHNLTLLRASMGPLRLFAAPSLLSALTAARQHTEPAAALTARLHIAAAAAAARRGRAADLLPAAAAQRGPASAVRAVPIKVISVSKGGSAALESATTEYVTRLRRYTAVEEVVVRPNPRGAASDDAAAQMAAEAERVVRAVGPRDRLVRRPRAARCCSGAAHVATHSGRRLGSPEPTVRHVGAALRARQRAHKHRSGAAAERRGRT